jgi:hypothetical protein
MSIEDGKIYIFQLTNNVSVVGVVKEQDEDRLVLTKPRELLSQPGQDGMVIWGLAPFMNHHGLLPQLEEYPLTYDMILMPRECPDKVELKYREQTGMVVPAASSLIIPT